MTVFILLYILSSSVWCGGLKSNKMNKCNRSASFPYIGEKIKYNKHIHYKKNILVLFLLGAKPLGFPSDQPGIHY
uniref:Secreted protein n=1 Tax=Octopus bimaculoides TaxID=37653 RepID=A0A0L8FM29_OCTBM